MASQPSSPRRAQAWQNYTEVDMHTADPHTADPRTADPSIAGVPLEVGEAGEAVGVTSAATQALGDSHVMLGAADAQGALPADAVRSYRFAAAAPRKARITSASSPTSLTSRPPAAAAATATAAPPSPPLLHRGFNVRSRDRPRGAKLAAAGTCRSGANGTGDEGTNDTGVGDNGMGDNGMDTDGVDTNGVGANGVGANKLCNDGMNLLQLGDHSDAVNEIRQPLTQELRRYGDDLQHGGFPNVSFSAPAGSTEAEAARDILHAMVMRVASPARDIATLSRDVVTLSRDASSSSTLCDSPPPASPRPTEPHRDTPISPTLRPPPPAAAATAPPPPPPLPYSGWKGIRLLHRGFNVRSRGRSRGAAVCTTGNDLSIDFVASGHAADVVRAGDSSSSADVSSASGSLRRPQVQFAPGSSHPCSQPGSEARKPRALEGIGGQGRERGGDGEDEGANGVGCLPLVDETARLDKQLWI